MTKSDLSLPLVGGRIPIGVVKEGFAEVIGSRQDVPAPEAADVDRRQLRSDQGICRGAAEEGVAVGVQSEQIDGAASPTGIVGQADRGEIAHRVQLHGGAADELLQSLPGRVGVEHGGIDLLAPAGAGQVAPVDSRPDRGRDPLPVDGLEIGCLGLNAPCHRVGEGVIDPPARRSSTRYDKIPT